MYMIGMIGILVFAYANIRLQVDLINIRDFDNVHEFVWNKKEIHKAKHWYNGDESSQHDTSSAHD